jgi:hypothetical protein
VGAELLEIVWGTAVGLALAHWFAFRLAGRAFRGERPSSLDTQIGLAQVGTAMFVAALSSLPVPVFSDSFARQVTGDVPATLLGVVGYVLARRTGSGRSTSVLYASAALVGGVLVALAESAPSAH